MMELSVFETEKVISSSFFQFNSFKRVFGMTTLPSESIFFIYRIKTSLYGDYIPLIKKIITPIMKTVKGVWIYDRI